MLPQELVLPEEVQRADAIEPFAEIPNRLGPLDSSYGVKRG